jgi:mannose-6-phosphate isomerase
MAVYPIVFQPIYKPKIWGGDRIFRFFDRDNPFDESIGESWELADLEEDQSRVARGSAAGRSITEMIEDWGGDLMGNVGLFEGRFPLLIKFLDARESLSVQVHPSEAMARKLGGNVRVKNEAWYILEADEQGVIYHGLEPGVTAESFRRAMLTGEIDGVLRRVPVKAGDCYYLPSGTPHALGAGVLVAEVQTPSDITYRTYDWGRVDTKTGQPRELHLDQAMECIDFDSPSPSPMQERQHVASIATTVTRLCDCPSFRIEKVRMSQGTEQPVPYAEPVVWIVLEGRGHVSAAPSAEPISFERGNVLLLPAALPEPTVKIESDVVWLEVTVPVGPRVG